MTTAELLTRLRQLKTTVSAENGKLVVNGPKGMLTDELRAELAERKAELLELLEEEPACGIVSAGSSVPHASRDKDLPLSFAQQRLWFLDQLEPHSAVYNVPGALRIKGPLNLEVLERCFNEILRRHEALRTTFATAEEEPVQIIAPATTACLPVIDIYGFAEQEREDEALRLAAEEASKAFDLRQGPLFRTAVIRLSEQDHVLLLTLHHIVSDGWSMGVLYGELSALYRAFVDGKPSPLPDLPIQYADFAVWQRNWLRGEVLENQLSYWKKQLAGAPEVLNLPTDRPRPPEQSYRGARQSIELTGELTQALKTLSRKEGATLYMILLAAFQIVLHRYTGQDDISVGSPIANRNRIEIEGLIGFFVNTVVLRTDLSGNPTFRELLRRVRDTALDAYAHQDLPFEKLVEELQPERELSRSPLFQVMFTFQNASWRDLELSGLKVSPMWITNETTKFDLTMSVKEEGGRLGLSLQYSTDLFNEPTIARLLDHFETVLTGIVANPDQRIASLPLLTDSEKQRILVEWNKTEKDYPKEKCLHELFEEQAKVTPESIAVVCEGGELTYGELNERSNRLAHYLRRLGVGPEVLVGICVERSVEMVVGLLGILKAGGAYLPIDPDLPRERIEFMMSDAEVRFVLTKESLVKDRGLRMEHGEHQSFMFDPRIRLIRLDRDGPIIAAENDTNLETSVIQNDLAYVIYTSGSTGQPKGVQVTHKSLLNLVYWHDRAFSVTPFDRATQLATAGFDAAVWELWPYLTVGASVYIADDMTRLDAAVLRDWLVAQAITISFVPTALAESLMTLDWPAETALRVLLTGGDALRVYPPDTLPFRVFNNYGPTECTVVSTSAQVWPNAHPLIPPTIGRPIANSKVYILDVYRNPVPTGVVGEIYIGGAGVARGYLNRPELTAETFISHSFDGEPEQRLYKTGDLARYLPDGNIQFMGRADYQVKIRGYRIELGEIETVLCRHAQVQEAVVVVREDAAETASGTDRRLVGYIGVGENGALGESELKEFLRRSLPDYMVPSAFVFLKNLPLTANGKLDRGALPAPACRAKGENFREPRNPTEIALADIWSQVLERSPIGLDDNFFDLGGHSLLSARLMARIKEELGAELPLRILFEGPTVAQLAPKIQSKKQESIFRQREQGEYIHLFELQAGDKNKPIFCFPFRGGLDGEFFNFTRIARHFGAQYSFYGLLARGLDGVSEPRRSVAEMAADYLEEIISVQPRGPYIFIGECQGGFVAYEAARQIMADGGEMGLLVLLDTHASVPARGFWRRCAVPLNYRVRKSPAWKYFKRRYDYHIQAMRRQSATAALGYSIAKMTRAVATVPFLINLEQAENPRCPESDQGRARLQLDRLKQTFDLAIRRYVLPCYRGRVSLLFNEQSYGANRMRDWADYIGGGMDVYKLPGGHDVCVPQNIPLVAEILRECLGGLGKRSESRHLPEPAYRRSRTSRL